MEEFQMYYILGEGTEPDLLHAAHQLYIFHFFTSHALRVTKIGLSISLHLFDLGDYDSAKSLNELL